MPVVDYSAKAPYETSGTFTEKTTDLWLVFHGYGQLAARFIQKFSCLNPDQTLVVAPQGPDRFYFDQYRKIGASWTTREHRDIHLQNQQHYLDAVWLGVTAGQDLSRVRIHAFGFSQGVSVATRWVASRKVKISSLWIWAGGYPEELGPEDWAYLGGTTEVNVIVGTTDEFITPERLRTERDLLSRSFPQAVVQSFEGGHEMPEAEMTRFLVNEGRKNQST